MKKILVLLLLVGTVLGVTNITNAGAQNQQISAVYLGDKEVINDFGKYFDEFNVEGSIVVYDQNKNKYIYYNPQRCDERFIPASSFKIVNSLIGLETGIIPDEGFTIKWNGVKSEFSSEWNKDHTLKSAFKYSVVWYYQELARQVGAERMQYYINKIGYGNENIGGGIDQFWLKGELRISQNEQIDLLKRLYNNELPFSQRTIDIVKGIMIREQNDMLTLRGKTGWATLENQDIGWYVGYVERDNNVYFFATNIVSNLGNKNFVKARTQITENVLRDLNIL